MTLMRFSAGVGLATHPVTLSTLSGFRRIRSSSATMTTTLYVHRHASLTPWQTHTSFVNQHCYCYPEGVARVSTPSLLRWHECLMLG